MMRRLGTFVAATALCGCDLLLGIPDVQPLPVQTAATTGSGGGGGATGMGGGGSGASGGSGGTGGAPATCANGTAESGELCFGDDVATYEVGVMPHDLVLGDCNDDDLLDILVALDSSDDAIAVLQGVEDGFAAIADIPVTYSPRNLLVTDLDGDPFFDLVAAYGEGNNQGFTPLSGDGDCTFTAQPMVHDAGEPPFSDFVLLEANDVPVAYVGSAQFTTTIRFWRNGVYTDYSTGGGAGSAMAAADLGVDGKTDLAIAVQTGQKVVVFPQLADSSGLGTGMDVDVVHSPVTVALGDVDGDGDADLVVGTSNDATIGLVHNSAGLFPTPPVFLTVAGDPQAVTLVDLDLDLDLDVVAALEPGAQEDGLVTVLLNADGELTEAEGFPISIPKQPRGIAVADVDLDGALDIAVSHSGSTQGVSVLIAEP